MAIYYRKVTTSATEPSSPALGDIWNKILTDTYQPFMWLKQWIPLHGGGNVVAEVNPDMHYVTVAVQETEPAGFPGLVWIRESALQAFLFVYGWIIYAGTDNGL